MTVVTLISSFYIMRAFVMNFINQAQATMQNQIILASTLDTVTGRDAINMFIEVAKVVATTVLPAMLLIGIVGILATGTQTKFIFAKESLKFKLGRINPLQGIKKLLSLRSLVELAKSLIKITVIVSILYNRIVKIIGIIPAVIDFDVMQAAVYAGNTIMSLLVTVGIAFTAVAALDYIYQRWEYEKNIKMTKQEVKDEHKQMEGNPQIKNQRMRKQRELAMSRMMGNVKDADVVVRNPTHFAVALRYRIDEDPAPIVLAKGADHMAARIVEEAEKHGIATVENPPLARGLYAASDIEETIPAEFFQPVAELLAWIYTTKKQETTPTYNTAPDLRPEAPA